MLFPLLEDLSLTSDSEFDLDAFFSSSSPISEQISQQLNDWEVLPSNTFMGNVNDFLLNKNKNYSYCLLLFRMEIRSESSFNVLKFIEKYYQLQ